MEGYLGQIANRSKEEFSSFGFRPMQETQDEMQFSGFVESNDETPPLTAGSVNQEKLHDIEEKTTPVQQYDPPGLNYLNRHITRIIYDHSKNSTAEKNEKNTTTHTVNSLGIKAVQEKINHASTVQTDQPLLAKEATEPEKHEKDNKTEQPDELTPVAVPENKSEATTITPVTKANEMTFVLPPAKPENVNRPSRKQYATSRVVIGRINVEVLPEQKEIIQKLEKRIVVESKPAPVSVNSRLVFGLGQL